MAYWRATIGLAVSSLSLGAFILGKEYHAKRQLSLISNLDNYFKFVHNKTSEASENSLKTESETTKQLRSELAKEAKGKVLEIGIGTGGNFKYYSNAQEVFAVDWSKSSLEKAKEKLNQEETGLKVVFSEADANKLPYEDNTFDSVMSTFNICSFQNPQAVLKEVERVLKPGGKAMFLDHGMAYSLKRKLMIASSYYSNLYNSGCRNNLDIDQIITKCPLKIIHRWREDEGMLYAYVLTKK